MKRQNNLKDALFTCICFTAIGLFNVGLCWEERSAIVEQVTWELQHQLKLSRPQAASIKKINYDFYDAIENLSRHRKAGAGFQAEVNHLIILKNKRIMKVLNEDQQLKWLKNCSVRAETKP